MTAPWVVPEGGYPEPSNPTCRNCGRGRHEHRRVQKPPVTMLLCPNSNHPFDPGCRHTADPAYDGRWCGTCNPAYGGDAGGVDADDPTVRQLGRRIVAEHREALEALGDE